MYDTVRGFLEFLVSAAGLSVVVTFATQLIKKYLKWEGEKALVLSGAVTVLVGVLGFLVLKYDWYLYIEEYWPLILALVAAIFGSSQLLYRYTPKRNGE